MPGNMLPGFEDAKALEREFAQDLSGKFDTIGKELIAHKLSEQQILQQSASDGGPATSRDALLTMVRLCKMGVRELTRESGLKRLKVAAMLEGTLAMSSDLTHAIERIAERRKPDWYK